MESEDTAGVTLMAVACPYMLDKLLWCAIRVRPRIEKQVAESIESKGIKLSFHFIRRIVIGPIAIRKKFNRRFSMGMNSAALTLPNDSSGVIHFEGIGKTTLAVDAGEIAAIQMVVESGSAMRSWPFLSK